MLPFIIRWDNIVTPFRLPPHLTLMLADIDAGSHTPSLVSKLLAWRKAKAEEGVRQCLNSIFETMHHGNN